MPVPVVQTPSGSWLVTEPEPAAQGRVVAYCGVSSADQKPDLDRQVGRVVQGATALGLAVAEVVTEVGSGLNGRRRRLHRVLSDPAASVLVVEHRDRLARLASSTSKPHSPRPVAAWSSWTLRRPPATWSVTSPRC